MFLAGQAMLLVSEKKDLASKLKWGLFWKICQICFYSASFRIEVALILFCFLSEMIQMNQTNPTQLDQNVLP